MDSVHVLLEEMRGSGLRLTEFTYTLLMRAMAERGDVDGAVALLDEMVRGASGVLCLFFCVTGPNACCLMSRGDFIIKRKCKCSHAVFFVAIGSRPKERR
jgi:pentatricopeptide repeat protein